MDQLVKFGANIYRFTNAVTFAVWHGFNTMASNNKSPRLMKKIGTHSGVFHCDEALACFMLKQLPEYSEAEIIRTRDMKILEECDIVLDVGGVYDPKCNMFDHHQRGFKETFKSIQPELSKSKYDNIVLSSAGLIYAHFGLDILTKVLAKKNLIGTSESLKGIFLHVYEKFIEEIDAIDNGVPMWTEGIPRYQINTNLSRRVQRINPAWNDSSSHNIDELFQKAIALAGSEFEDCVFDSFLVWWPAHEIVKKSIEARKLLDDSRKIVLLSESCAWKEHLFALEEDMDIKGQIQFCIFSDKSDNSWRVQAVPIQPDSFICRTFLHEDWQGLRDEELSKVAGIENCIFCHATGFIGGNKTKEGALQMAKASLAAAKH